jgi:hypothetical protein
MATAGQIQEGELRSDQLEIGKIHRMEQYGRPTPGVPHQLIDQSYWRFFQTAQDHIVPQFEQRALQIVFEKRLDKASAYGLTKNLLGPSKKSGGRKYKIRQTKLRRKNRTRKNRRRMR